MIATSLAPAPSSAARIAPTWPSIIPLGATMWAPAAACASAIRAYSSRVRSLSTSPSDVSTPQCPWSVYSSRQRSVTITASSPKSSRSAWIACCVIPSGFHASVPSASLCSGTPNRTNASTPFDRISAAALRTDSTVCCDCPGIDAIGIASPMPSFTNSGAMRSAGSSVVSRTSARSAGVRRRRRGRSTGKAIRPSA